MHVLADSCSMAKTNIKSKRSLYHVYIQQMQRNAACTFFCQSLLRKQSCHAVSWEGWGVGVPVCWTDGLTWRATGHVVTSSLIQHMWPADAKVARKSLLKYLRNTLSCVFMPFLRVALHCDSLQCHNKLGWGAKITPSYMLYLLCWFLINWLLVPSPLKGQGICHCSGAESLPSHQATQKPAS